MRADDVAATMREIAGDRQRLTGGTGARGTIHRGAGGETSRRSKEMPGCSAWTNEENRCSTIFDETPSEGKMQAREAEMPAPANERGGCHAWPHELEHERRKNVPGSQRIHEEWGVRCSQDDRPPGRAGQIESTRGNCKRHLQQLVGEPFLHLRFSYGDELALHFGAARPYDSPRMKGHSKAPISSECGPPTGTSRGRRRRSSSSGLRRL